MGNLVTTKKTKNSRTILMELGRYALLVLLAIFSATPILLTIWNSLKTQLELTNNPLGVPSEPQWQNYLEAWTVGRFSTAFASSLAVVIGSVLLIALVSTMAAYPLSRLEFPKTGKLILYLLVLNSLPIQLFLVPLFFVWSRLGLYDTHLGLVIIYTAVNAPFATLLLRSFMIGIPRDYEDAARVDGAGEFKVFLTITLPLAWSGILTISLVAGLAVYNEFFLALMFIQSPELMPISTSLFNFRNGFSTNFPLQAAAGMMMLAPMILAFLILHRRFVSGITSSGLAGA
jgi:raffinose/stachyose/melibiose transport system permease protein